eukprot:545363-Hanusia_phi.AAC.1
MCTEFLIKPCNTPSAPAALHQVSAHSSPLGLLLRPMLGTRPSFFFSSVPAPPCPACEQKKRRGREEGRAGGKARLKEGEGERGARGGEGEKPDNKRETKGAGARGQGGGGGGGGGARPRQHFQPPQIWRPRLPRG